MAAESFERHDHGSVQIDLCFGCAGIWFDHFESVQLSPAAVIGLFREIYAHRDDQRRSVTSQLQCPRCRGALTLSYDLGRTGRFSYFRCQRGDGRFTPFYQFLREKQFVRNLTSAELQRVRAEIKQVNCSECGAPIDLEHDSQCRYCHAPVSFLDAAAVEQALRMWSDAENRRSNAPSPEAIDETLQHLQWQPRAAAAPSPRLGDAILLSGLAGGAALGMDLIGWGIHAIGRLFEPQR